jgi:hypothetical protein
MFSMSAMRVKMYYTISLVFTEDSRNVILVQSNRDVDVHSAVLQQCLLSQAYLSQQLICYMPVLFVQPTSREMVVQWEKGGKQQ